MLAEGVYESLFSGVRAVLAGQVGPFLKDVQNSS